MPTTSVQIMRRPPWTAGPKAPAIPVKAIEVEVPRGAEEHGDGVRLAVHGAVATFAALHVSRVSVSHREGGGYIAYIPPIEEKP